VLGHSDVVGMRRHHSSTVIPWPQAMHVAVIAAQHTAPASSSWVAWSGVGVLWSPPAAGLSPLEEEHEVPLWWAAVAAKIAASHRKPYRPRLALQLSIMPCRVPTQRVPFQTVPVPQKSLVAPPPTSGAG
jgi:hypothetical protein